MDECKPLPSSSQPMARSLNSVSAANPTDDQGLTLVHFSAQRKHVLLDTLGA